ncbi:hypothetical protein [Amaricoccus solimangrovi]|uniref:Uncharacterized protein n=1 Tax=Amaricoccus solimangrovi TaxID=2589815 RepID=A0A501WHU5_9RHOB|nr:hypothetical protein [Amaricoccus solimangrovi]TPE46661.1 hypothetical protein FJM51_21550 [Amaricoccus solimangrovi]
MAQTFFDQPNLNSPHRACCRQWVVDGDSPSTERILKTWSRSELISAMPDAKRWRAHRRRDLDGPGPSLLDDTLKTGTHWKALLQKLIVGSHNTSNAKRLPHHRFLTAELADGRPLTIPVYQGFGRIEGSFTQRLRCEPLLPVEPNENRTLSHCREPGLSRSQCKRLD